MMDEGAEVRFMMWMIRYLIAKKSRYGVLFWENERSFCGKIQVVLALLLHCIGSYYHG